MKTMADVRKLDAEKGQFFFSKDNMGFFGSRIESKLCGERFFITSERVNFISDKRAYTVRLVDWETGDIRSEPDFQSYKSLDEARQAVKALAREAKAEAK